jgi:hypothetical protein
VPDRERAAEVLQHDLIEPLRERAQCLVGRGRRLADEARLHDLLEQLVHSGLRFS